MCVSAETRTLQWRRHISARCAELGCIVCLCVSRGGLGKHHHNDRKCAEYPVFSRGRVSSGCFREHHHDRTGWTESERGSGTIAIRDTGQRQRRLSTDVCELSHARQSDPALAVAVVVVVLAWMLNHARLMT